jgi:hypothetical protein
LKELVYYHENTKLGKHENWKRMKAALSHPFPFDPSTVLRAQGHSRHRGHGENMLAQNPHKAAEAVNPSPFDFTPFG